MCWNKEVSFGSYFIIVIVGYLLFKRNLNNDRFLSLFILSYGGMQLLEGIIWVGIEQNNVSINKFGSILACLLLYLHPIALCIGIYYDKYYKNILDSKIVKIFVGVALLIILIPIYKIIKTLLSKKPEYTLMSYADKVNKHLVWDFPGNYYFVVVIYLLLFVLFITYPKNKKFSLLVSSYYFIPPIIIGYLYGIHKYSVFGSYWCWVSALFAFIFYIANPYLQ